MTPLDAIPVSAISWLLGMMGCSLVGIKGYLRYRRSHVELSKYIAWFGILVGIAQAFFSIPLFFTLNLGTVDVFYLIGQLFFFASMVAQAAIVWCLLLRSRLSVHYLTIPTAVIGLASWLYAIPRAHLFMVNGFLEYYDPRPTTLGIAVLLIGLFVPVGVYFLRMAPRQNGFKAVLTSATFGIAYIGIGLVSGGFEIFAGQIMIPATVTGNSIFFTILLVAALWPRRDAAVLPTADGGNSSSDQPARPPRS